MEKNSQENQSQNQNQSQATQKKKQILVSAASKDKAEAAKAYIERKYGQMLSDEQNQKEHWELLQKKMASLNFSQAEQELIKRDILFKQAELSRKKREKRGPQNYEPLAIIGRGAFGEVRVCKDKDTKEVVAIKKMKKNEMLYKNQIGHVRAERYILSSFDNPWIVELKESFQDDKFLYLVMEFLVGGDLMTVLMKKDILTEEEAKFYTAELVLSVASVHKMNYIHRDLKPDNVLLGKDGHIKLSDFGLCKQTEIRPKIDFGRKQQAEDAIKNNPFSILTKRPANFQRNRQLAFSTVGTPDYIAPEVFGQQGYTETVDWWSIGVILFEMLVGYPPFFSEDPSMTCQKILHWKKTFMIPPEANLSPAANDLIKRLINEPSERLGINGVEEIKVHPFFSGVDWKRIREKKAPYVPPVNNEIDVQNFDKFTEDDPWVNEDTIQKRNRKMDANFAGYTFKRDIEGERPALIQALENLENTKLQQVKQIDASQVQRSYSPRPEMNQNIPGYQNPNLLQNKQSNRDSLSHKNQNNLLYNQHMSNNQHQNNQVQAQKYAYLNQKQGNQSPSSHQYSQERPSSRGLQQNNGVHQYQFNIKKQSQNRSPSPNSLQKYGNTYFLQQMQKNQNQNQNNISKNSSNYQKEDANKYKNGIQYKMFGGAGGRANKSPSPTRNSNNNILNNNSNNINNNNLNNAYNYKSRIPTGRNSGSNSPRGHDTGKANNKVNYQGISSKYFQGNQRQYSPNSYRNY